MFEEGRKQYLQALGAVTNLSEEDSFEAISGLGPTIAVKQGIIRQSNPRSVVGTKPKILSYLGTLYTHDGNMVCSQDAVIHFADIPTIHSMLIILERTGMGYITLGQPASTLSDGEAQRMKLTKEIGKCRKGKILYILDEPITGLSSYDVAKFLALLHELIQQGHSVIVVEHDPSVLSYNDWIIELGPGGGQEGGEIIVQGTPADILKHPNSKIAPFPLVAAQ